MQTLFGLVLVLIGIADLAYGIKGIKHSQIKIERLGRRLPIKPRWVTVKPARFLSVSIGIRGIVCVFWGLLLLLAFMIPSILIFMAGAAVAAMYAYLFVTTLIIY